jgi:hypothetical protein
MRSRIVGVAMPPGTNTPSYNAFYIRRIPDSNNKCYDRVFSSRIEPARGITGYGGVSIGF